MYVISQRSHIHRSLFRNHKETSYVKIYRIQKNFFILTLEKGLI